MMVACYARKSKEDKKESINNQLAIMRSYIESHPDLCWAEIMEFVDNGYSGINLEREAFQELLSKVRQRIIDVVMVKDLSRLGRNYLDVCKLMDSIFPFMGVRLIAVADNYDSNQKVDSIMYLSTAFKSILNEYYVIEASEKQKKSCALRVQKGEFVGGVSYGYFLSDKYTPQINEEQAAVVRKIFSMYLDGNSLVAIARELNQNGVLSPQGKKWNVGTIWKMLKNEQYIGKKTILMRTKNPKTKRMTIKAESEWYINEHALPPIIDREIFDKVQALFPPKKTSTVRNKGIMARKIYCACCKKTLYNYKEQYYYCRNGYLTGKAPCYKGSLKRKLLYPAVLHKVKLFIGKEIATHKPRFSYSDIVENEKLLTNLKEK